MLGGRVLHFGKYDGCEIERVLEIDPEYLLWASANIAGHGIPQQVLEEARIRLDSLSIDEGLDEFGWENE